MCLNPHTIYLFTLSNNVGIHCNADTNAQGIAKHQKSYLTVKNCTSQNGSNKKRESSLESLTDKHQTRHVLPAYSFIWPRDGKLGGARTPQGDDPDTFCAGCRCSIRRSILPNNSTTDRDPNSMVFGGNTSTTLGLAWWAAFSFFTVDKDSSQIYQAGS